MHQAGKRVNKNGRCSGGGVLLWDRGTSLSHCNVYVPSHLSLFNENPASGNRVSAGGGFSASLTPQNVDLALARLQFSNIYPDLDIRVRGTHPDHGISVSARGNGRLRNSRQEKEPTQSRIEAAPKARTHGARMLRGRPAILV